jgi:hypothetical protein
MTEAKKKAEELVEEYNNIFRCENVSSDIGVQCAIIAVDEIISHEPFKFVYNGAYAEWLPITEFWEEVKEELNKMLYEKTL